MPLVHTLTAAADLSPAVIGQVAAGGGVRIGPGLLAQVQARCAAARRLIASGAPVYGVNTGLGALSGIRLTAEQQAAHQRNLLAGRAVGGPPWLTPGEVRALFAVRLRTFLSGDAGVSAQLCEHLVAFLAADIVPAVPGQAAGSAGEIVPLAHAFGPLAGLGRVLADRGPGGTGPDGTGPGGTGPGGTGPDGTVPAGDVLAARGLAGFTLGPKEGIALLAGVPGATALSLLAGVQATAVTAMMAATAALSITALGAPPDPYDPACARADEVLGVALERLRADMGVPARPPRMLQAPVSFRVAGPVLAQVMRAADALAAAVGRALAGVTDSPAFTGTAFIGTAGFHGVDLAAHCDQLTAALAHAAEVSAARTHRLLDPAVTGLLAQLAPRPGPDSGLVAVHKRAAGEVHALRRLAVPSALGSIETSGGQEDVQSFAWAAAQSLRTALRHARLVTACETLTACQAAALRGGPWPRPVEARLARLAELVEPVSQDRPLGQDIDRLAAGSWLD